MTGVPENTAKEIMGKNFFGTEELERFFRIKKSKIDVFKKNFSTVPYPEKFLFSVKETHFLIAVFPLSIVQMSYLKMGCIRWAKDIDPFRKTMQKWCLIGEDKDFHNLHFAFALKKRLPNVQTLVYANIAKFFISRNFLEEKYLLTYQDKKTLVVKCINNHNNYPLILIDKYDWPSWSTWLENEIRKVYLYHYNNHNKK